MSDWLVLGLFAIAFYLYECCTWTPATVFACYRKPLRKRWAAASGAELPGNESGGFALADPLTSTGTIIHCAHWPVAVSPDGLCLDSADAAQFWPFDSIQSVSSYERTVRINGDAAFRAGSESLAIELAAHLQTFRALHAANRADAIRAALGDTFDAGVVETTWSRFLQSSRALTRLALMPVAWLLLVTPLALVLIGPLRSWRYLLGGLFLTSLAVAVEFVRVHRTELPRVSDRWLHAVSMALFPIAAIRAADRISKERLASFNPFAVVGVFCDEAQGDPILRRLAFDVERPAATPADTPAARCREWYHAQKRSACQRLLKALRRDPFREPERVDADLAAYCPRCHSQFQEGTKQCSDCADVELIEFVDAGEGRGRAARKRKRA
jgi:hypothetical protein